MALHIAALLLCIVLMPLLAVVPMRLLASLSAIRRGSRERANIARLAGNGSLVVRGTLRVEGAVTEPGGASVGAFTIWSSARRFWFQRPKHEGRERAEKLTIVAGDQRYELRGPVEVLSGSRTTFEGVPAQAFDRRAYAVRTALSDGEEVIVAGAATGAAEGQKYRDRGATVIEPTVEAQVIFASATKRSATRVPIRALVRHFSVFLLMFVGCYPLYKFAGDYSNIDCASACKDFGLCGIESNLKLHPWKRALKKAWEDGDHVDCAATSAELCRASTYCNKLGHCTAVEGDCVAATIDDCRNTPGCLSSGACSPIDGNCRASADDCRYTAGCVDYGRCDASAGFCHALTDESCKDTPDCRNYGRCSAVEDRCTAAQRGDCATTEGCIDYGRCTPVEGYCTATSDADCRGTTQCRERGMCSLVNGQCAAKTNEDCRDSRRCSEARECQAKDGGCVEDAAQCRDSVACRHWGHCDGDGFCSADAKTGCAKAGVCQGKTGCRPLAGDCATDCKETEGCRQSGRCTLKGKDECVADSDADCAASAMCRSMGHCSLKGGRCALTSSADCAKRDTCKTWGQCSLVGERCQATRADCAATTTCKRLGRCTPDAISCKTSDAADCQGSEVCEKFGWCTPVRPEFSIEAQCGPAPRN